MAKKNRIAWKRNAVVSMKLGENLYTLGQMLTSPAMQFFDVCSKSGEWQDIDLNKATTLFAVFVGQDAIQRLAVKKMSDATVCASKKPYIRYWIKPKLNFAGGFPFRGGRLIDLGTDLALDTTYAPVIKEDLTLDQDRALIQTHELTNMWGAEDLGDRLRGYFKTKRDRDTLKEKIFPGFLC